MNKNTDRLWTLDDVAEYLQVKVSVVRYWTQTEGLPHIRIGRLLRFDPEDVREWVRDRKDENKNLLHDFRKLE